MIKMRLTHNKDSPPPYPLDSGIRERRRTKRYGHYGTSIITHWTWLNTLLSATEHETASPDHISTHSRRTVPSQVRGNELRHAGTSHIINHKQASHVSKRKD